MAATLKLPIFKLGIAAISSAIALALPLKILSHSQCILIVRNAGYWLMLCCCALFLWKVYSTFRKAKWENISKYFKAHWFGLLLAGIIAGVLATRDAPGYKILYDEHVLSSTARSMHIDQIAYVQAAGHIIDGKLVATAGNTDKRPLLFPFVLSVGHNIFGYSANNVFVLNMALCFALLVMLYALIARLSSRSYGAFGLLLIGGLPLLAQNATGGGYELLNLCMILALILSAIRYFVEESPSGSLDLMIMSAILLANIRYESVLYVLVPPAVFLLKSLNARKLQLTWFSALSPLLLIIPLLSYRVFRDQPNFIRTSQENFFSLSHLPENVSQAFTYLFDWQGNYTNSVLLSVIGLICLTVYLACCLPLTLKLARSREGQLVFLPILLVVLANTTLALCNWWGGWTDPATQRFSLPLQLSMVICAVLVFSRVLRSEKAPIPLLALSAGYFLLVSPAHSYRMQHEFRMNTAPGYNWAMDWIRSNAPPGNHLYIADSAIGLGLLQVSGIPITSANAMPERVAMSKELGLYDEVFILEELIDTPDGPHILGHLTQTTPRLYREPITRTYISPVRYYQISRLVKLLPEVPGWETLPANLPKVSSDELERAKEIEPYYRELLPLVPAN